MNLNTKMNIKDDDIIVKELWMCFWGQSEKFVVCMCVYSLEYCLFVDQHTCF